MVNIVTFVLLKGVRFCFGEQCNRIMRGQGLLISFFDILHICALSREGENITEVAYAPTLARALSTVSGPLL
jgi:hypothetical protein